MPPGTPVPPERTLATQFDTSRTTVRQALQELVVEGRLERIQGKGTFVAKPKVAQVLQLTSYTEDMRAQGLEPTSQLLDIGVFDRLRRGTWWRAPLVATVVAALLDSAVFWGIGFAGTGGPWLTWALGDLAVKLAVGVCMLLPFRLLIARSLPSRNDGALQP